MKQKDIVTGKISSLALVTFITFINGSNNENSQIFSGLAIIAGSLQVSKVNVYSVTDDKIAKIVHEKRSKLSILAAIIIFLIVISAEFFLIGAQFNLDTFIKILVCLACYAVGYLSGKRISESTEIE